MPSYSTQASACFDVHACVVSGTTIKMKVAEGNGDLNCHVLDSVVEVLPGSRALIPTGLIFDIPLGHSLRLHPRSGLAFKNGLMLANCEGVIDEDYVDEVFVAVYNSSTQPFVIKHGDRIAQCELVKDERTSISETTEKPSRKTDRNGGFGSTGV